MNCVNKLRNPADDICVICRMNDVAGRDHWGHTFSVLMGGGHQPRGIDSQHVTFPDRSGRPMHLVETEEPIRELVRGA